MADRGDGRPPWPSLSNQTRPRMRKPATLRKRATATLSSLKWNHTVLYGTVPYQAAGRPAPGPEPMVSQDKPLVHGAKPAAGAMLPSAEATDPPAEATRVE